MVCGSDGLWLDHVKGGPCEDKSNSPIDARTAAKSLIGLVDEMIDGFEDSLGSIISLKSPHTNQGFPTSPKEISVSFKEVHRVLLSSKSLEA